jgi:hypothetical protein
LHIDAVELPKFEQPDIGQMATPQSATAPAANGKIKVIGVIDDHTRPAYTKIHSGETAQAVSATLRLCRCASRAPTCLFGTHGWYPPRRSVLDHRYPQRDSNP